jgi:uncharacterized protein YcbK (DUF882 family)
VTPHFSLAEFCGSDIAARRGIDNALPDMLRPDAEQTLEMLERIRVFLSNIARRDVPIVLSSGYRCQALNLAVGGSITSDHRRASAADWTAPAFGTPVEICRALAPHIDILGIGQLIHEYGRWVHTSWRLPMLPDNRVITITVAGTSRGIQEA